MYCGHCGTKLKDDANFCGSCGKPTKFGVARHRNATPVQTPAPVQQPVQTSVQSPEPAQSEPVELKLAEPTPMSPEPESTQPESVESEPVIPAPVYSEPVELEPVHPEPVSPELVHPEPVLSEPARPNASIDPNDMRTFIIGVIVAIVLFAACAVAAVTYHNGLWGSTGAEAWQSMPVVVEYGVNRVG